MSRIICHVIFTGQIEFKKKNSGPQKLLGHVVGLWSHVKRANANAAAASAIALAKCC